MSSISDRTLTVGLVVVVILSVAQCRPQQQAYLPPSSGLQQQHQSHSGNNPQTFYVPPAGQQLPYLTSSSNQQQQQRLTEPPIQLQIPIPNDGVQEKKIYVQLPPQQPQQYPPQPQYRYPPRKHYKIILVRSPTPPTPPPAPVLPEIEEQTLVYVLVQKPDTPSVAELQQHQQQSLKLNKPEVYFIKYKANEQSAEDGSVGRSSGDGSGSGSGIGIIGSGSGSGSSNSPEAVTKSIEHQLSNNLEGAIGTGGGGGYSYDGSRKREAKNLTHLRQEDISEGVGAENEANKVTNDVNQEKETKTKK